jgi:hypothetical protein
VKLNGALVEPVGSAGVAVIVGDATVEAAMAAVAMTAERTARTMSSIRVRARVLFVVLVGVEVIVCVREV